MELDQEMPDLGLLENIENAPVHGVGAADDDGLRCPQFVPAVGVAEQLGGGIGEFQIIAEFIGRDVGDARAEGELAAFTTQMSLEAVLEEIPDALAGLGLRLA